MPILNANPSLPSAARIITSAASRFSSNFRSSSSPPTSRPKFSFRRHLSSEHSICATPAKSSRARASARELRGFRLSAVSSSSAPEAADGASKPVDLASQPFVGPTRAEAMNCVRQLVAEDPVGGWDKAWKTSTTPWDLGAVTPAVASMVAAGDGSPLQLPPSVRRVLVPGCGAGYDVEALASHGREATGLDISAAAVAHAQKRVEGAPNKAAISFVCADFFDYRPEQPFDAIFDYTFFCALPPSLRPQWAAKTAELLRADGVLYTLMFPIDSHEGGPPFSASKASYAELLEPLGFTAEDLPTFSVPPREGKEQLAKWQRLAPTAKV